MIGTVVTTDRDQRLSVREAARIIYSRNPPSEDQVRRVQEHLERGDIRGDCNSSRTRWSTTAGFVAEYLASRAYPSTAAGSAAGHARAAVHRTQQMARRAPRHAEELESTYQELLTDYFLAIVFRRKQRRTSRRFDQTVVAGQIAIVLLVVFGCLATFTELMQPAPIQHVLVEHWIAQQNENYRITRWFPLRSHPVEGSILRVQYHYQNARGRGVDTDRTFHVDGSLVELYMPD